MCSSDLALLIAPAIVKLQFMGMSAVSNAIALVAVFVIVAAVMFSKSRPMADPAEEIVHPID